MAIAYEILNSSGLDAHGQMGTEWTLYSIDESNPDKPITELMVQEATDESLNAQLTTIGFLAAHVVSIDPAVKLSQVLITGEYLTIAPGTKSIVKQYFLSLVKN